MEAQSNIIAMIQFMDRPAFCVRDGVITGANQAALARLIPVGTPIWPLLRTGHSEYAAFSGGWLSLTLELEGIRCDASVSEVGGIHLFTLEPDHSASELRVLSLAAQELRNPLSRITAMTDRLFPHLDMPEDSPQMDQMARINRGLYQLLRVVSNMSDAARYCATIPTLESRDVNAVVGEVFDHACVLLENTGFHLEYHGLNSRVYSLVDSEQLERCIYNILSNALKSCEPGSTIHASLTRSGNTLYLTVRDPGHGLSTTAAGNVFTRYLREPSLEAPSGLGLGMTLIRSCAAAHGGTVLLKPSENQGLALTISLPVRLRDDALHCPPPRFDYAGERYHGLIELSDILPPEVYQPKKH